MSLSDTEPLPKIAHSIEEITQQIPVSAGFIRKEIERGNLKARKFGRRVLILDTDLREYLDRKTIAAAA